MRRTFTRRSFAHWLAGLVVIKPLPSPATVTPPPPTAAPIPLAESRDPVAQVFLRALMEERGVAVYYHGGTTPGALRIVRPETIYRLHPGGRVYVRGRCELRGETRTFRLDRARLA